jgi:hypothetical protein
LQSWAERGGEEEYGSFSEEGGGTRGDAYAHEAHAGERAESRCRLEADLWRSERRTGKGVARCVEDKDGPRRRTTVAWWNGWWCGVRGVIVPWFRQGLLWPMGVGHEPDVKPGGQGLTSNTHKKRGGGTRAGSTGAAARLFQTPWSQQENPAKYAWYVDNDVSRRH